MNPYNLLRRPEYILRPRQILSRLRRDSLLAKDHVQLAWGLPVHIDPTSHVGGDILNLGVCDRVVPETILRLLDSGELSVDVGANLGQNTSIMALAAGNGGRVIAIEPSPQALELLSRNVAQWSSYDLANITIETRGMSSKEGIALMYPAEDLGGFSLDESWSSRHSRRSGKESFAIEVTCLDSLLRGDEHIGVLKIDVEGHEADVLEGANGLLAQGRVRDIIFEDFEPQPSRVVRTLESHGFTVLALVPSWSHPLLIHLKDWPRYSASCPPNFLATRSMERAMERFHRRGWQCLRLSAKRLP